MALEHLPMRRTVTQGLAMTLGLAILLQFATSPAGAEDSHAPNDTAIHGVVEDAKGAPLEGVRVHLVSGARGAPQDFDPARTHPPHYANRTPQARSLPQLRIHASRTTASDGSFMFPSSEAHEATAVRIGDDQPFVGTASTHSGGREQVRVRARPARRMAFEINVPSHLAEDMRVRLRAMRGSQFRTQFVANPSKLSFRERGPLARGTVAVSVPADATSFELSFQSGGVSGERLPFEFTAGDETARISLADSGSVRFAVMHEEGDPAPGARVRVELRQHTEASGQTPSLTFRTWADAEGMVSLRDLPVGFAVSVVDYEAEGYARSVIEDVYVPVDAGAAEVIPLVLDKVHPLTVRVVDTERRPIAGCVVAAAPLAAYERGLSRHRTTHATGTCEFTDFPRGAVSIKVWKRGMFQTVARRPAGSSRSAMVPHITHRRRSNPHISSPHWVNVEGQETTYELVLHQGAQLVGRVVDATGSPVSDLTLYGRVALERGGQHRPTVPGVWSVKTDSDGRFTLDGLPPNRTILLRGETRGFLVAQTSATTGDPAESSTLALHARAQREVRVEVRTPTGERVLGTTVRCIAEDGATLGMAAMHPTHSGWMRVPTDAAFRIVTPFHTKGIAVAAGTSDVDRVLTTPETSASHTLTVLGPGDKPLSGLVLYAYRTAGDPYDSLGPARTNDSGVAVFPAVPAATYAVRSNAYGPIGSVPAAAQRAASQTVRVKAQSAPTRDHHAVLRARVLLPDGSPVHRGRLHITAQAPGATSPAPWRGRSSYAKVYAGWVRSPLASVPQGKLFAHLHDVHDALGRPQSIVPGPYPLDPHGPVLAIQVDAAAELRCRVVTDSGEPLKGVTVTVRVPGPTPPRPYGFMAAPTDANGMARFGGLVPGLDVHVQVQFPEALGLIAPKTVVVSGPQLRQDAPLQLELKARTRGTQVLHLVDDAGVSLSGVNILVHDSGATHRGWDLHQIGRRGRRRWFTSDGNGRVRIEGLHPAHPLLIVHEAPRGPEAQFHSTQHRIEAPSGASAKIVLTRLQSLHVLVVAPDGTPIPSTRMTLVPWWAEERTGFRNQVTHTDADGVGHFTGLRAGEYLLDIHKPHTRETRFASHTRRVKISGTADLRVVAKPLRTWEPRLLLPSGHRFLRASLFVPAPFMPRAREVQAGGTVRVHEPGVVGLRFSDFSAETGTVAVWTRDASGQPNVHVLSEFDLSRATVTCDPKPSVHTTFTLDAPDPKPSTRAIRVFLKQGRFWWRLRATGQTRRGIPEGTYDVIVEHPNPNVRKRLIAPETFDTRAGVPLVIRQVASREDR